jgi:hypothetical protein
MEYTTVAISTGGKIRRNGDSFLGYFDSSETQVLTGFFTLKKLTTETYLQAIESSQQILREVLRTEGTEAMELTNIRRLVASYDMGKLTRDSALCSNVFR